MNGEFAYDTLTEKGTLKAVLSHGKLMPNEITELAAKYLKTDITKETYEGAGLNATIDKKLITTDIGLKSHKSSLYALILLRFICGQDFVCRSHCLVWHTESPQALKALKKRKK